MNGEQCKLWFDDVNELNYTKEKQTDIKYFSDDEIIEDLTKEFVVYEKVEDYVKNIMSIPKAKWEFNKLCQGYQAGYNISLLFNPHRLDTPTIKSKSIFEAINTDLNYRKAFARYITKVQDSVVVEKDFYKYIGIGSGGIQYVNEFCPWIARDIYKKYCKDGYVVLDPCSGWGGRTLGLASCMFKDIKYITTDPSKKTFEGLLKLKEFLNLKNNFVYYNLPFEDLYLEKESIDFCFTSPPYFDTERYSQDEGQSFKRNSNYEMWRDNFLYVMLDKILYALKEDRYCLLNVGKVRYPIDEDIINYLWNKYKIQCNRVSDFRIGGFGIGARTDEEGMGEPFIEFKKEKL